MPSQAKPLLALIACALIAAAAAPAAAQSPDAEAIEAALADYILGFYEGDAGRMVGALHPELHKLRFQSLDGGKAFPDLIGREALAAYAEMRKARGAPVPETPIEKVQVLAVDGDIATARAVSHDFIDLVHLARVDGRWQVVNVLWAPRERPAD